MGTGDLLHLYPSELKFPFVVMRQSSCIMQLTSNTDQHVAFKIKANNPKRYCVRPNVGVVVPGTPSNITVTLQPQREAPPDMKCGDKFLVQCVVARHGATAKAVDTDTFNREPGKVIREFMINVTYVPANIPPPVPEEPEEGFLSPKSGQTKKVDGTSALLDSDSCAGKQAEFTSTAKSPQWDGNPVNFSNPFEHQVIAGIQLLLQKQDDHSNQLKEIRKNVDKLALDISSLVKEKKM